jgi:riboflavin kinase/FMN adenylyltransferase
VKIHHSVATRAESDRPLVLAVGFFDGMHRGHREIVRAVMRLRRPGFNAGVLTFENHPRAFLRPGSAPPLITTLEERVNLFAELGIDEAYVVPFDERISSLDARAFLEDIIVGSLRARALVFGENFRFGNERRGDASLARDVLAGRELPVVVVPSLLQSGERISSTRVRRLVAAGEMEAANDLLGASYALRGQVVLGHGRGHDLGFPTANLAVPPHKLIPRDGVYSAIARHDGIDRAALISLGTNPTFENAFRSVEVWLRDFSGTIYGEQLALRELRFIREQRTFERIDDLIGQIKDDATHVAFPTFSVK